MDYLIEKNFSELQAELSEQTLSALREFCLERELSLLPNADHDVDENWELSQFWYDEKTADVLAEVALDVAGENGRIACISSPTAFKSLKKKNENLNGYLLEYDKRFQELYPDQFVFYDYNQPLNVPGYLKSSCDVLIVDPPYLSEECLQKTAQTVKLLSKGAIILCTGAVMEECAKELLQLKACEFQPGHEKKLGNEFKCYANFDLDMHVEKIVKK